MNKLTFRIENNTTLVRVSEVEAFKLWKKGEELLVCPCNMSPVSQFAFHTKITDEQKQRASHFVNNSIVWKGDVETTAWNIFLNNFYYYNCNYELGYYASFYQYVIDKS